MSSKKNMNYDTVNKVKIIFLVENKSEMLVRSKEVLTYYTQKPLLAEPGLSLLIQINDSDEYVLFDSGASSIVINENAKRMGIDLSKIKKIVLSHGHFDHSGGMTSILTAISSKKSVPLYTHPDAFRIRWMLWDDGRKKGPLITPKNEWIKIGADIKTVTEPNEIEKGCYTTGYIPRISFENLPNNGVKNVFEDEDGAYVIDDIPDEIGLVLNVKDKGLVVISGCAHAGILNTVYRAQEITGVNKIYAIIGGFHLAFSSKEYITSIIKELKVLKPRYIIPTHCTGFEAMKMFSECMQDEFLLGTVGSVLDF